MNDNKKNDQPAIPMAAPGIQPDAGLLQALANIMGVVSSGEARVLSVVMMNRRGEVIRIAKTDQKYDSKCMLHSTLMRLATAVSAEMDQSEAAQISANALAQQRARELAKSAGPAPADVPPAKHRIPDTPPPAKPPKAKNPNEPAKPTPPGQNPGKK